MMTYSSPVHCVLFTIHSNIGFTQPCSIVQCSPIAWNECLMCHRMHCIRCASNCKGSATLIIGSVILDDTLMSACPPH